MNSWGVKVTAGSMKSLSLDVAFKVLWMDFYKKNSSFVKRFRLIDPSLIFIYIEPSSGMDWKSQYLREWIKNHPMWIHEFLLKLPVLRLLSWDLIYYMYTEAFQHICFVKLLKLLSWYCYRLYMSVWFEHNLYCRCRKIQTNEEVFCFAQLVNLHTFIKFSTKDFAAMEKCWEENFERGWYCSE